MLPLAGLERLLSVIILAQLAESYASFCYIIIESLPLMLLATLQGFAGRTSHKPYPALAVPMTVLGRGPMYTDLP